MEYCYCCETPLGKQNLSIEHIIPNSLGGKIKSNKLLCTTCNNLLGREIDDELAKQLNFFMNFFMIERERGKFQTLSGKTKGGEEYILNGIEIKSKPKISVDKDSVSFTGNDEKDVATYFKGLLKKYPQLKMKDIIANAKKGKYYLNEPVSINLNVGGEKFFRAVTKIAVNFHIHKGGDKKSISNLLDYINGKEKSKKTWYHFGFKNDSLVVDEQKLYHFIKIIGSSTEKTLYCYIELFGTLKFIVCLNDNYEGSNIDHQYFYNLFSKVVIDTHISMSYSRKEILDILNVSDNEYFINNIQKNMQHTLAVAYKIHSDKAVSNLLNESIEKVFKNDDGSKSVVSEEMLTEFINDISYSMAVYLARDRKNGKTHF